MRAAVTVAGRVNKQGPVAGTGAAAVKVASLATAAKCFTYSSRRSHRADGGSPRRPEELPLEGGTLFHVSFAAWEVFQRIKGKK